jgi:hypothetical protein
MWLEAMVWVWAPLACAGVALSVWRSGVSARELGALRKRVAELEARDEQASRKRRAA